MAKTSIGIGGTFKELKEIHIGVNGAWKKVKEGYVGIGGEWKKFFGGIDVKAMEIAYTGKYTDQVVTMADQKEYRLLTLTGSGTLTLGDAAKAQVWVCSGGNQGMTGGNGGTGGSFAESALFTVQSALTVRVGAGNGGQTSVDGIPQEAQGAVHAGSGGGQCRWYTNNLAGGGVTTRPFRDAYFDPLCGGGGGGGCSDDEDPYDGGDGGTDGGNGNAARALGSYGGSSADGGGGGFRGGGAGGSANYRGTSWGNAATFYGGGGGGGGFSTYDGGMDSSGGSGYQGVVYVRIPVEQ